MKGVNEFINQAKKIIRKENIKINNLHREIDEYETLIEIIGRTETAEQVITYREKINQCYNKIDLALESIRSSRDRIAVMKAVEKIIKRGEKCA